MMSFLLDTTILETCVAHVIFVLALTLSCSYFHFFRRKISTWICDTGIIIKIFCAHNEQVSGQIPPAFKAYPKNSPWRALNLN